MSSDVSYAAILEWELSLPSDQILSHGWYHGALSRSGAESLLQQDREFLVRDSTSQTDSYVLSCRSNGQHLHFVIQKLILNPETVYERYQYQFEDEAYDTVADLITSYVGSGKPISAASGARIQYPSNRAQPLTKSAGNNISLTSSIDTIQTHSSNNPYNIYGRCGLQHKLSFRSLKNHRSHSLTPIDAYRNSNGKFFNSADGVILQNQNDKKNYSSEFSASGFNTMDSNLPFSPPAKPARGDAFKPDDITRRHEVQRLQQASGSDSGNGSCESNMSSAPGDSKKSKPEREFDNANQFNYEAVEAKLLQCNLYELMVTSKFNLSNFKSQIILPGLTKPLESDTLHTVKMLLRNSGPRILANHMANIDFKFLIDEITHIEGLNKKISGIELSLLPHGRQMRTDIIERIETMKLLIAVTILTCQTDKQRAETINDWILLAIETKTALGNLYGFTGIMLGLCMPQIECLTNVWSILRREFTDNAFSFEAKLRPCFKSMNDGSYPIPPNTTTPHILPPILCYNLMDSDSGEFEKEVTFPESLLNTLNFDYNATVLHLEAARYIPKQIDMFKRNARTVIQEISSLGATFDPVLLDFFHTEFQTNFLWGHNGGLTRAANRFGRLTEIVTSMSSKLCSQQEQLVDKSN